MISLLVTKQVAAFAHGVRTLHCLLIVAGSGLGPCGAQRTYKVKKYTKCTDFLISTGIMPWGDVVFTASSLSISARI